jgi:hypothetical protein
MTPRILPPDDLTVARELAEVALLDVALDVMLAVLRHHQPTLDDDYRPTDGDDLLVARHIVVAALELRSLLDRYRLAVRRVRALSVQDELPF